MPKPLLLLLVVVVLAMAGQVRSQQSRQLTKADERIIKRQAMNLINNSLLKSYNQILTSTSDERKQIVANLLIPGQEARVFLNEDVIIENDFATQTYQNLPQSDRDTPVEKYFSDLAANFGLRDNGDEPNPGKNVTFPRVTTSKIQRVSPKDSLFIKVYFTINYEGIAKNYAFKEQQRVAELQVEQAKKSWRVFIKSIRFFDESQEKDYSKNVTIASSNKEERELNYDSPEVLNAVTKMVSRNPLLKAFAIDEMWGLLKDEDSEKKVLFQPIFCEIGNFSEEGLAAVCKEGLWGYIDRQGKVVVGIKYDAAKAFKNGKAKVQLGMDFLTIDPTGKVLK